MAVVRGEFVHFRIRDIGGVRICRISPAALLIRERLAMQDGTAEIVLSIFERHRGEIERIALAMAKRIPDRRRIVTITTAEFNG